MLHFVQQYGTDQLQSEENRPKFCTFYNIDSHVQFIHPFFM